MQNAKCKIEGLRRNCNSKRFKTVHIVLNLFIAYFIKTKEKILL